jgi:hypothetical protein
VTAAEYDFAANENEWNDTCGPSRCQESAPPLSIVS